MRIINNSNNNNDSFFHSDLLVIWTAVEQTSDYVTLLPVFFFLPLYVRKFTRNLGTNFTSFFFSFFYFFHFFLFVYIYIYFFILYLYIYIDIFITHAPFDCSRLIYATILDFRSIKRFFRFLPFFFSFPLSFFSFPFILADSLVSFLSSNRKA